MGRLNPGSALESVNGASRQAGLQIESGVTRVDELLFFVVIPAHAGGVAQGSAVHGPEDGIQSRRKGP